MTVITFQLYLGESNRMSSVCTCLPERPGTADTGDLRKYNVAKTARSPQ